MSKVADANWMLLRALTPAEQWAVTEVTPERFRLRKLMIEAALRVIQQLMVFLTDFNEGNGPLNRHDVRDVENQVTGELDELSTQYRTYRVPPVGGLFEQLEL